MDTEEASVRRYIQKNMGKNAALYVIKDIRVGIHDSAGGKVL